MEKVQKAVATIKTDSLHVRLDLIGLGFSLEGPNGGDTLHLEFPTIPLPAQILSDDVMEAFDRAHIAPHEMRRIADDVADLVQRALVVQAISSRIKAD